VVYQITDNLLITTCLSDLAVRGIVGCLLEVLTLEARYWQFSSALCLSAEGGTPMARRQNKLLEGGENSDSWRSPIGTARKGCLGAAQESAVGDAHGCGGPVVSCSSLGWAHRGNRPACVAWFSSHMPGPLFWFLSASLLELLDSGSVRHRLGGSGAGVAGFIGVGHWGAMQPINKLGLGAAFSARQCTLSGVVTLSTLGRR